MDLDVVMKSNECLYIVQFYGALFKEVCLSIEIQILFMCTYNVIVYRVIVGFVWNSWILHWINSISIFMKN